MALPGPQQKRVGVVSSTDDTTYNTYGSPGDQVNNFRLVSSSQFWYAQASAGIDRSFGLNNFSLLVMADQRRAPINFDLPATYTNLAGKASYNYNNKYFAEGALNYSGFDRYEPGKRFGLFFSSFRSVMATACKKLCFLHETETTAIQAAIKQYALFIYINNCSYCNW